MAVNNETGCVQPLEQIGEIVRRKNHLTFPRRLHPGIHENTHRRAKTGIHLVALSAHKFHGPMGVGALYCKKGINLRAWQTGGGQELGLRSGTENLPGIAGMGKAVEVFGSHFREYTERMTVLKERMRYDIGERIENIRFNTPEGERGAPHILSGSFRGVRGSTAPRPGKTRHIHIHPLCMLFKTKTSGRCDGGDRFKQRRGGGYYQDKPMSL